MVMDLVIENVTIIPMMQRGKIIKNASIHIIKEGKIIAVSRTKQRNVSEQAKGINGEGMVIMPGLINAVVAMGLFSI